MDPKSRYLPAPRQRSTPRADRPCAEAQGEIAPGTEIGGFEVLSVLGRTRLGHTFLARQLSRDRRAVLKVLSSALASSPQAVKRFHSEAALAGRLTHPGILPVLSAGSQGGYEFYATALSSGPTLAEFIERAVGTRGDDFFREAALRMAGLARTVEALHRSGVLHRKLAPASIFLEGDRLLLTDFEMAVDFKCGERPEQVLGCEEPLGPTVYLAPEEFLGGAAIDSRTDVYSLGMTLYELAAGLLPFPRCSNGALARLKLTRKPIAPRRLNPEIPLGLEAVIRQAIEAGPTLRHSSAGELAHDLERFAARKRGPTRRHGFPTSPAGPGEDEEDDSLPDFASVG
jgi:serine/threonine-protein kinase